MRLTLRAVGRMKSGPERELLDRYIDRAGKAGRAIGITDISIIETAESRAGNTATRRDEEAAALMANLQPAACLICLDERGRDQTSAELSQIIQARLDDGTPEIAFAIGGPDGHGEEIRNKAALVLRFGKSTWPHQLVRVMTAEQIYRAITILTGHPYHRE